MNSPALPMRWASPAYVVLLALAFAAFWPGYIGKSMHTINGWTHFHAAMGTLWLLALIVQPWAIHSGRRQLHRMIGRSTYVLMPLVVISFIGLAHASMQGHSPREMGGVAYFFYIRVVLVSLFVIAYVGAIVNRHQPAIHARYMVCTGLALVDPVVHRLAHRIELWAFDSEAFDYQLLSFGLVAALLVALIWMERRARVGRHVFPLMLAAFFIGWLPLGLELYKQPAVWNAWKAFAVAFAAFP